MQLRRSAHDYSGGRLSGAVRASLLLQATGRDRGAHASAADGTFVLARIAAGIFRLDVDHGSLGDSLEVAGAAAPDIVLARGDTAVTQVRLGYAAVPTTIAGARAMQPGRRVIIAGVALTSSSVFGDQTLHVLDATGSLRATQVLDGSARETASG